VLRVTRPLFFVCALAALGGAASACAGLLGIDDVDYGSRDAAQLEAGDAPSAGDASDARDAPLVADAAGTLLVGVSVQEPDEDGMLEGTPQAWKYTAVATGPVATLALLLPPSNTGTELRIGLYSDVAGVPGQRLTSGTLLLGRGGGWSTVRPSPRVSVQAGEVYWIALLAPNGAGRPMVYDRAHSDGGTVSLQDTTPDAGELPATWTKGTPYPFGPISAYAAE
jgi:hypothetical protein